MYHSRKSRLIDRAHLPAAFLLMTFLARTADAQFATVEYSVRAAGVRGLGSDDFKQVSTTVPIPPQFPVHPGGLFQDVRRLELITAYKKDMGNTGSFQFKDYETEAWAGAFWQVHFSKGRTDGFYRATAFGQASTDLDSGLARAFPNTEIAVGEIGFIIDPFVIEIENPVVSTAGNIIVDIEPVPDAINQYTVQLNYGPTLGLNGYTYGGVIKDGLATNQMHDRRSVSNAGVWSIGSLGQPKPLTGISVLHYFEPVTEFDPEELTYKEIGDEEPDLPLPPYFKVEVAGRARKVLVHQSPVDGDYGTTDPLFFGFDSGSVGDNLVGQLISVAENSPMFASFSLPELSGDVTYQLEAEGQVINVTGSQEIDLLSINPAGVPNIFLTGIGEDELSGFDPIFSTSFASEGSASFMVITYASPHSIADYDVDGDTDGADFLAWQRSDGTSEVLSAWNANFGMSSSEVGSADAVPEPSALLLAVFAAALCNSTRKQTPSTPDLRRIRRQLKIEIDSGLTRN